MYLTSLEPLLAQTMPSQSLGGYISSTLVGPETTLTNSIGIYDETIVLDTPTLGDWSEWTGIEFIGIGPEVIKVEEVTSNTVSVLSRYFNNNYSVHSQGDRVVGLSNYALFNNVVSEYFKQYRCVAYKNTDSLDSISDVFVDVKNDSQNPDTTIKIAVELPKSQYYSSTSSSWTSTSIVDPSLGYLWEDDQCKDAYLRILDGPNANKGGLILSYDAPTGTFVLYNELPVEYDSDVHSSTVSYEVEPAPSQRIKTGIISPVVDSDYMSDFSDSYVRISEIGSSNVFGEIGPEEIFYVWIERSFRKTSELYNNNNFYISLYYTI